MEREICRGQAKAAKICLGRPPKQTDKKRIMNDIHTEPTSTTEKRATAVPPKAQPEHLNNLFKQGWEQLLNQQWQRAEEIFAQIETYHSHYEQDGLRASYLRQKARYEREAAAALAAGKLKAALAAFRKADDFEHVREVHDLLTVQELEARAEKATAVASYQTAAWLYDHLLNEFPTHEKTTVWQIKKGSCWEAELQPYFEIGVKALEKNKWRSAYSAFAQVLLIDPYFCQDGRSAAVLSEIARKEVVLQADQRLRQGQVQKALDAYRQVGHLARIENIEEFLRLRRLEEESAQQLEAEGKWLEAAAKYNYLCTLYYDKNGRAQWQAAAKRCQKEHKLTTLYEQGMTAFKNKAWQEAAQLFGQIVALCPDYAREEQPIRKLYRTAQWHSISSL